MANTGHFLENPLTLQALPARSSAPPRASTPASPGSWRYHGVPRSRWPLVIGMVTALTLILGVGFGVPRQRRAPPPKGIDTSILVSLVMPDLRELEEPERVTDSRPEARFDSIVVPRQIDMPTVTTSMDFIQAVDFSTIIDKSSLKAADIAVPDNRRSLAELAANVFNLADLDRKPEVIFQPEMNYPSDLKRAGVEARVVVEFIVDETGATHDAVIVEASVAGFETAARNGVMRWRFRPGMKDGAKVRTRMRVPIEFKVEG